MMTAIQQITTVEEMKAHSRKWRQEGKTIVLVPTMGYFHEGHLSLMRKGRAMGDRLVVSIFVNPAQFGSGEDFENYPRDLNRDLALAENEHVDAVFTPDVDVFYGPTFQTYVTLEYLPKHLCGPFRPTHFRGVSTVVCKLLNAVQPHIAIFGQKDYQQLLIVRQMVSDLNMGVTIVGGETIREADGLAMSSRNTYLSAAQRESARSIYQALTRAQKLIDSGTRDTADIISAAAARIESHPDADIDYISICDPDTLEETDTINRTVLMAVAVRIGKTRLIDNMLLTP